MYFRLLTELISTRNAHSPVTFPLEDVFWLAWYVKWRCKGLLWSEEIIYTTSVNTIVLKNVTKICLYTCHPVSGMLILLLLSLSELYHNYIIVYSDVEIGDIVTIGECRPLSKTVRFNVLKVTKGTGAKKGFKKF